MDLLLPPFPFPVFSNIWTYLHKGFFSLSSSGITRAVANTWTASTLPPLPASLLTEEDPMADLHSKRRRLRKQISQTDLILKSEPKTPTYRIQRRRWRREIREREGDENIPPARETRMSSAGDRSASIGWRVGEEHVGEERTGAEIYGELETCGLRLLACSKESRGRGGQFAIEGTRMTTLSSQVREAGMTRSRIKGNE